MKWKIYFADGSTFDSDQGDHIAAPCKGVAVIVTQSGHSRRMLHGRDWYRWLAKEGRWAECSEFDILMEVATKGSVIARRGEYMDELAFEKILIAAHEDPFIQVKKDRPPKHPAWRA